MNPFRTIATTARRFANAWKSLDGAAFTMDRASWQVPMLSSPDREVTEYDRLTVAKQTWYFYQNVGMVRGAVNDIRRYSVGDGLRPVPLTDNEGWNIEAMDFFERWTYVADVAGMSTWGEIEGGFSTDADTKGERFLLLTKQGDNYPAVQVIESQAIGTPDDKSLARDGFVDGVKVNAQGRPVAYMLKASGRVLPASAVIHFAENLRPGQLRGIPSLAHAVTQLFDAKDIKKNELMAGKINAAVASVLTVPATQGGDFLGVKGGNTNAGDIQKWESVTGVQVLRLAPGSSFASHKNDRPNANFIPFLDYIIRDVSIGLGLPPEFVWDSAALGGATARLANAKATHRMKERRKNIIAKVSRRVWLHVIGSAIDAGLLPPQRDWWRVAFRGPASPTADAGRDAANDREDFKLGFTNLEEIYSEQGEDWRTGTRQKARELKHLQDLATEFNVPFDTLIQLYPNPPQQANTQQLPA